MKYVSVLLLAALCCLNPALAADKHSAPHAKTNVKLPTEQDQKEVKRIAVGYLIALQQLKPDLMAEVMSPELNKQTSFINRETGKTLIRPTTYEQMLEFAKTWNAKGDKFPKNPSNRVTILDMQGTMASVKLESDRWYEYLHLAKIDGQWKILNLYWQNHPDRKH